ncbi:hypothetical protein AB5J49_20710 [Streptomyces sp. R28]|uniref:Uncharacterized protein n=1 Tax=Streptomyces sp. R28 TaxID=3238628 RepID=A0AB39PXN3_9ACTN
MRPGRRVRAASAVSLTCRGRAADLDAWVRLLGLPDVGDLADAEIDTMCFRLYHRPGRLTKHTRRRLRIDATWPWTDAFTTCRQRLSELAAVTRRSGPVPTKTRTEEARTTPGPWNPAQPQRHATAQP